MPVDCYSLLARRRHRGRLSIAIYLHIVHIQAHFRLPAGRISMGAAEFADIGAQIHKYWLCSIKQIKLITINTSRHMCQAIFADNWTNYNCKLCICIRLQIFASLGVFRITWSRTRLGAKCVSRVNQPSQNWDIKWIYSYIYWRFIKADSLGRIMV